MAAKFRRERYAICRPGSSTFSVEHFPQPRRRRFRAAALGCIEKRKSILGGRVMKNGLRVYDADTHVEPSAEVIDKYVDPGFRPRLEELAPYRMPIRAGSPGSAPRRSGRRSREPGPRHGRRRHRYAFLHPDRLDEPRRP